MADLDNDKVNDVEIGVVGSGSMGSGMTLLFSEHGSKVACYDYDGDAVQKVLQQAKEDKNVDEHIVHGFTSLDKLFNSFPRGADGKSKPRIFVLSLPHGKAVDGVLVDLLPHCDKGDIIIDGGNEWWEETERRQKRAAESGVHWIGMGVSGGYQAARHGPSMSPGGAKEAFDVVEPYLQKWAAKTTQGEPCVEYVGPGGCGHYVKMIHNGIEHAHLSIICEVRALLHTQLGMSNDEIAKVFEGWYESGPLRGNFLLGIGYKGLMFKKGDGIQDERGIIEGIEDKVTQDVDSSEGTGTWSTKEIAERHVAAPAIAAAHQLRVISADKHERLAVIKNLTVPQSRKADLSDKEKADLVKVFETATYGAIFGAFIQGLEIITRASTDQKWNVSLALCMRIWRAGCIIRSDAICELLLPLFEKFGPNKPLNLIKDIPEVGAELSGTYVALKRVCALALEMDAVAPALSASLEWLKAVGGKDLPTNFEELELDYFGNHMYDIKGQADKGHEKGRFHTEFQST